VLARLKKGGKGGKAVEGKKGNRDAEVRGTQSNFEKEKKLGKEALSLSLQDGKKTSISVFRGKKEAKRIEKKKKKKREKERIMVPKIVIKIRQTKGKVFSEEIAVSRSSEKRISSCG